MAKDKKPSPFMQQYMRVKAEHPDKLVLFRMGDFYEVFFEDAITASSILGITLTSRDSRDEQRTPMAGIPYHALNEYLPRLIKANLKVAICDQVEDPAKAKGLVKREVTRVVTRGTITEDNLLEPGRSNFLMALAPHASEYSLCWLDFSTGEVFVRMCAGQRLADFISTVMPGELICPRSFERSPAAAEIRVSAAPSVSTLDDWNFSVDFGREQVCKVYRISTVDGLGLENDSPFLKSMGALTKYLEDTQFTDRFCLRKVTTLRERAHMVIDRQTLRNLEIFRNQNDGSIKGTLYECLNRTATPMGSRKLGQWIAQPLYDMESLRERLDLVESFTEFAGRDSLIDTLKEIRDIERPLARLSCGRFSARDMKTIGDSLSRVPRINSGLLEHEGLRPLVMPEPDELAEKISVTLNDELPLGLNEGGMIREGINSELDELRAVAKGGRDYLNRLQEKLRSEYDLPSLKVNHNKVFGYYIEVSKAQSARVPDHFVRKQTLVNAERYIISELKEYEDKIFGAQDKIIQLELEMIQTLREAILAEAEIIQQIADGLATVDVLSNFAALSKNHDYVKPKVSPDPTLLIRDLRHPVIERLLNEGEFCPNDVTLSPDGTRLMILTGPNMSGKSTYIRSVGLVQIMFQIGCFIPARSAVLGLVDRVFSRVGAGDDLSSGRSTFMVEMNETANILHNATPRSLVILDEVGRGTSTLDGLSLAWAVSEELHDNSSLAPLCLFATHYHELTALETDCPHVKNFHVRVEENRDDVIFLHKIEEGGTDKSYGVHVARLAGLPDRVIRRAQDLLKTFEGSAKELPQAPAAAPRDDDFGFLFEVDSRDGVLKEKLDEIDPDEITPLQALIFLKELKDSARQR